jgi:Na+/H+ antiporter NhaA
VGPAGCRTGRPAVGHSRGGRRRGGGRLHLPRRVGWREIVVIALASSTGFTIALFFATGILSNGPVRSQLTTGALATAGGALIAFGAGRLLRVGRFAS